MCYEGRKLMERDLPPWERPGYAGPGIKSVERPSSAVPVPAEDGSDSDGSDSDEEEVGACCYSYSILLFMLHTAMHTAIPTILLFRVALCRCS
jgi:hypothetical protein